MKFSPIVLLALASVAQAMVAPRITAAPGLVARQSQDADEHEGHDHNDDDHAAEFTGSIPPPPAESTGCELHDDHYHCEGPATGTLAGAASGSVSVLAPPAESTGCVLHDDHYDCEGPATAVPASASGSGSIPAPPAESTGCELHGDHYHCEGPASATSGLTSSSASSASSSYVSVYWLILSPV